MLYFCAYVNIPSLNDRDGMSAITLYFPAILVGVRYDAFLSCCRSANNRSIIAASIDAEVLPMYVYATVDVLSQKLPTCLNFISSATYSSTSHPRTNPASSRSFIVKSTFWICVRY